MQPGDRVRIKSAPDRIGVLTNDVQIIGGKSRWVVQFADAKQRFPEKNLELVDELESIENLIEAGNFGSARHLRGAITHARLTGKLADVIYSMESTNTEFYAYQFKPVLNFLSSPSNGILIADEVGLGKTIEAGLIWTELRARENAKRLLILCPAVLRHKWKSELNHRFGIRAEICDAANVLERLKDTSRANESFALVASIQGLRPSKNWEDHTVDTNSAKLARFIEEEASTKELFDCVIVDEAHYMRNSESQTHKLGQLIRPATKNIVLLSATPIQLKSDDLFHLLNIIDNENFEYKSAFDNVLNANQPIMELASWLRSGNCSIDEFKLGIANCLAHHLLKDNRQLKDLDSSPPIQSELNDVNYRIRLANRIERINLLGGVVNRTRKRDVKEHRVVRDPQAPQITMNDIERNFYEAVTERVRQYCERYDQFEGFLLTIPQRQMCSSMPAALRAWQKKIGLIDDEILSDTLGIDSDAEKYEQKIRKEATAGPLISELSSLAQEIGNYELIKQNDSKYNTLKNTLQEYWRSNPGYKVVLFSFYRETLKYLLERLKEDGVNAQILMGGMGDTKDQIVQDFKEKEEIQILLTSEVLSEGVDLQFSSTLINYDLPWNPMRVEQRIGRIDRIGQKADRILILNLFYEDTIDDRIYNRLFKRLDIFTHALGDLEAVLGQKIRNLTYDLLRHDLTKEQEKQRIEQTASAIANEKQNQEELETEAAGLAAHGDYVLNKVSAAKEMRRFIDGENLWIYVRDFLKRKYRGSNLVEKDGLSIDIDLSSDAKNDLKHFLETSRDAKSTNLAFNAIGKPITCKFYNNVDLSRREYEVINQYHPLVQFAAQNTDPESFHQVIATKLQHPNKSELDSSKYLFLIKRWSTTGAKTEEKLIYRAINLATGQALSEVLSEKLIMAAISHGSDWLEVKSEIKGDDLIAHYHNLEESLDNEFEDYQKQMRLENEDRIDLAISTVNGQIDRQIATKQSSINTLTEKGNHRMVKLFEAQIKNLESTRENRTLDFNLRRKINNEPRDVIMGVIYVQ
jgi:superfamily II DNA or RNA helicase